MLWPPVTMATQHPDNASAPWWKDGAFIATQDEIEELLLLFRELAVDEYMWDWEGKYVDESVGEKLFSRASEFFTSRPLGESLHLTYRIPAYTEGKMHRMARAFMNILALSDLAREIGLPHPPVTEMFLPLTMSADQPLQVRKAFREVADYHRAIFRQSEASEHELVSKIEVTPLVEDVESLFAIEQIVRPYWESLVAEGKDVSHGQRVFLARSDPALNAGLVPAVLAAKVALSVVHRVAHSLGFSAHPIIGTGSLPFRGSVHPRNIAAILDQYAGTRTYSIQSAYRYDYPLDEVASSLQQLKSQAPHRPPLAVPEQDAALLRQMSDRFTELWKPTIESLAPTINAAAAHVPPRRERLQHIGLFGYSRGIGSVRLPRAIGFTSALYSLGVPPELIATGRGLRIAREQGWLDLLDRYYPTLRADLTHAGFFLNRENIELLARRVPAFGQVAEDIAGIEDVLGIDLGPRETPHILHRNITSTIFHRLHGEASTADAHAEAIQRDIVEAGVIRRSLG